MTGQKTAPVRGTQKLVDQMGWVFRRPTITALEIVWRWLFGVPFLLVCWARAQQVMKVLPPESAGLANINAQNPWIAATQLGDAWSRYEPLIASELRWAAPAAALAWIVVSSLGRSVVFRRLEPRLAFRPLPMLLLQAIWLLAFGGVMWCWFESVSWAATTHITADGEPDLIGYSMWVIFLSLAFFTVWALVSWAISVAPLVMLLEDCSPVTALARSLRLGRGFTSKLVEVGMVMGIVNLALIVLAMVFSAAPLPFSDQLGPDAMHLVWIGAVVFYLVASDYFQVVRLKSFVEFWKTFREERAGGTTG
jgi:hypothetical protein